SQSNNQDILSNEIIYQFDQQQLGCQICIWRYFDSENTFSFSFLLACFKLPTLPQLLQLPKSSKLIQKSYTHILQNFQHMVGFSLSSFFKRRLGLETRKVQIGLYCTVIRNRSESKCALSTALTSYSIIAPCYGRVGAEYNSWLPVNNARRLFVHGFLTTRSPNLTTAVV
ncbi:hypothetical protein, partial [Cysteiniphilum litorale]|uniref:hypothetical protein n=2 Tax=Cysteiniphilum TaxID=2056696 RepID=UPI0019D4D313